VALWWAFRPEKLWINQRVNEAAPFDTSGDPEPIFTGQFDGKAAGRVTVFKKPNGQEYLRLRISRYRATRTRMSNLRKAAKSARRKAQQKRASTASTWDL